MQLFGSVLLYHLELFLVNRIYLRKALSNFTLKVGPKLVHQYAFVFEEALGSWDEFVWVIGFCCSVLSVDKTVEQSVGLFALLDEPFHEVHHDHLVAHIGPGDPIVYRLYLSLHDLEINITNVHKICSKKGCRPSFVLHSKCEMASDKRNG